MRWNAGPNNIINCWRWDYENQLLVPFEDIHVRIGRPTL